MQKKNVVLFLTMVSLFCLAACGENHANIGEKEETVQSEMLEEGKTSSQDETSPKEEAVISEDSQKELEKEKVEKVNLTKFENLPKVIEQVGFSFRTLENFTSQDSSFSRFKISEKVEEVNGIKLAEPFPVIKIEYLNASYRADVTIFPYEGENLYSAVHPPICYVSTKEINGIDVHLAEYILCMVPEDYEMTEEDWEFMNSGKGSFSCDFATLGDVYYRSMYWVQDGNFYELAVWKEDAPVEEIEELVAEYMNGELQ